MTLTHLIYVRVENDPTKIALLQTKGWVTNEPPAYNAATHTQHVWDGAQWFSRLLTAEELAKIAEGEATRTERIAVRNAIIAMQNGTGTAAERITRLERACVYILKNS